MAGSASSPADASAPNGDAAPADGVKADAIDHHADLRGKCNLKTSYPDDEACIPPPPPGTGMQIHVGPTNYDDPAEVAQFLIHPGDELDECFTLHTPNDKPIHYQTFVLSGRKGTHHIINTMYSDKLDEGKFGRCSDAQTASVGTLPGASKPYMARGTVAPEYAHVGRLVPAQTTFQADMHYYNFTNEDIIREFWLNIYFVDDAEITEEAQQIRGFGGLSWNSKPIQPGTDEVYKYSCPIKGDGYLLSLLGHYHAHGKRFTATIQRASGALDKVFEMYDYTDPATFEYNTVVDNPAFSDITAGAVSGRLAVHDGDSLLWECHIINDSDVALHYVNMVKTGEMCNIWGASVGVNRIDCLLP
jgi:hypothetical protein